MGIYTASLNPRPRGVSSQLVSNPQHLSGSTMMTRPQLPANVPRGVFHPPGSLHLPISHYAGQHGYKALYGHTNDIFSLAWNPKKDVLVTASKDGTARIWDVASMSVPVPAHRTLHHPTAYNYPPPPNWGWCHDVSAVAWNADGSGFATGCFDSCARIWSPTGDMIHILPHHSQLIHNLQWNKAGTHLLTCSRDSKVCVWDTNNGRLKQQFSHQGPAIDVQWMTDDIFASCSQDGNIFVCELAVENPIRIFHAHTAEVNRIEWNPQKNLLASCSEDLTLKIWSLSQDTCVKDLKGHTKETYELRWSPTGPGTANPNMKQILASGGGDFNLRMWDVEQGACIHSIYHHTGSVFTLAFSPDGKYLASGSSDRTARVWSTQTGEHVMTFLTKYEIFFVQWNSKGDKLALGGGEGQVIVLDFLYLKPQHF